MYARPHLNPALDRQSRSTTIRNVRHRLTPPRLPTGIYAALRALVTTWGQLVGSRAESGLTAFALFLVSALSPIHVPSANTTTPRDTVARHIGQVLVQAFAAPASASSGAAQADVRGETQLVATALFACARITGDESLRKQARDLLSISSPEAASGGRGSEPLTSPSLTRARCPNFSKPVAPLLLLAEIRSSTATKSLGKRFARDAAECVSLAADRLKSSDLMSVGASDHRANFFENALWFLALHEAAPALQEFGEAAAARTAVHLAERLHAAIERHYWVKVSGAYASDVLTSPTYRVLAGNEPELRSQLVAIAVLPPNSSLRKLFADIWEARGALPASANTPQGIELLAWLACAAYRAGESAAWEEVLARLSASPLDQALEGCPALAWVVARAAAGH